MKGCLENLVFWAYLMLEKLIMEDSSVSVQETLKWIRERSDGSVGHKVEVLTTRGIRVVKARKGFLLCDFIVHNSLSDEKGNWHVGAIAALVDIIGSLASYSFTSCINVTVDLSISYYSSVKVQEEVEIEAEVAGKKEELTSVIVQVRKKENEESVAMGKLWSMRLATSNAKRLVSRL